MSKTKVLYVVSDIDKSLNFEWTIDGIDKNRFELIFFLIGKKNSKLALHLNGAGVKVTEFSVSGQVSRVVCFFKITFRLFIIRPDVVHTHLHLANVIGLSASWLTGVPKRIFTRHYAMVHYNEYPGGLKWDKLFNRIATHIVAISENVKNILINKDGADPLKIRLVHHGFDLPYFQNVELQRIRALIEKYELNGHSFPVVGVISRYLKLKGIQYVLPAFKKFKKKYPEAHLILVNTHGNYSAPIKTMLEEFEYGSFTEILFEYDLAALYKLFDIFVHVPVDAQSEAFGQTYVEALTSGVPSVFTLSGVAPEFIVHEQNALVVPFKDADSIYQSLVRIVSDDDLKNRLIANGKKSATLFPVGKMISQLEQLYES